MMFLQDFVKYNFIHFNDNSLIYRTLEKRFNEY